MDIFLSSYGAKSKRYQRVKWYSWTSLYHGSIIGPLYSEEHRSSLTLTIRWFSEPTAELTFNYITQLKFRGHLTSKLSSTSYPSREKQNMYFIYFQRQWEAPLVSDVWRRMFPPLWWSRADALLQHSAFRKLWDCSFKATTSKPERTAACVCSTSSWRWDSPLSHGRLSVAMTTAGRGWGGPVRAVRWRAVIGRSEGGQLDCSGTWLGDI